MSDFEPQDDYRRHQPQPPPTQARRRPGRVWRLGSLVSGLLSFSLVAVIGFVGALYWLSLQLGKPGPLAQDKTVLIAAGSGLASIARNLERNGVISNRQLFILGVSFGRASGRLKAGEYEFKARSSMNAVMAKLVEGRSIRHKITFPEGLTSAEIVEKLNENSILIGKIEAIPEEGSLLPDTYLFQRGNKRGSVIEQMQKAQEKLMDELWPKRADGLPIKTRAEALTLASIVEKETGIAAERPRVAAVFINRLRKSMRLQSDPTIIYGITGGKGPLGRPIRQSEINRKTPYNTYQIDGLPPTPIANPGRASIAAVLNPLESDELFFVADGSGGHVFARTLAEHQKNVANWRKIEAARRKAEAEARKAAPQAGAAGKSDRGSGASPPAKEN